MWPDVEMKQIPYLNNHNNLTRAPLIINRRAFFLLRMNVPLSVSVLKLTDVRQTLKHLWWRRGQSRGNIRICGRNVPHTFFKQWNGKRVKASSSLCSKVSRLPFCVMLMVPVMKHDVETRGVVDHGYPHRWAGLNSEVDDRTMRSQHPVTWYYYLSRIQSYPDCGWGCKENITSQATNSPERPNYKATGLIQPAEGSAESQIPTTVSWQQRQWTGWWQIKGKLWKLVVALLLCVRASWQLCLEPPSSPSA